MNDFIKITLKGKVLYLKASYITQFGECEANNNRYIVSSQAGYYEAEETIGEIIERIGKALSYL